MRDDQKKWIELEENVLKANDNIAAQNRAWFQTRNIKVLNLISSPGSGKTFLLEKTLLALASQTKLAILVGDQETDNDAQRLAGKGGVVKQINTHDSCHLDAHMIQKELGSTIKGDEKIIIIENIGNLVCPASFDLGEKHKIALLSTTEGEDKPLKYPTLFHNAAAVVITKCDLIPHLDWSMTKAKEAIYAVNPHVTILEVSAKTGQGMEEWFKYLRSEN